MSDYTPQDSPPTGFFRAVRVMGIPEAAGIFIVLPAMVLALVQFLVELLVVHLTIGGDPAILSPFTYFAFWFTSDPPAQYGVQGAAALHWTFAAIGFMLLLAVMLLVVRFRNQKASNPQKRPGLASIEVVRKELGTKQLLKQGSHLRPSTTPPIMEPHTLGFLVGTFRGSEIWLRVEDPTILIGPSRAGKGWMLLLWWIISAPGAVITTSSKLDNARLTMRHRERRGSKSWILAPGVPDGKTYGNVLQWDAISDCIVEDTLVRRIHGFIPGDSFSGSTSNGGHWDSLGQQLAADIWHAAACGGVDVDKVWDWVVNPQNAHEAVHFIRNHPDGMLEYAAHLEGVLNSPPEQLATQWGVLPTVFKFLNSRTARSWLKPAEEGPRFDPVRFVLERQTVYLVGDKKASSGYTRVIDAFLAEIDHVTKGLANISPGGRLDPAVTYVLDELGNFEYAGLNELITAGGGLGRVAIATFQSKTQLQQYGGPEAESTLWDAATAKLVLPGGGDPKTLDEMADLIGQTWVERESQSLGDGTASRSLSAERQHIFTGSQIRTLKKGYVFLFYRNLEPVVAKCEPFSKHPDFKLMMSDAAAVSADARERSEFAAVMDAHLAEERSAHA